MAIKLKKPNSKLLSFIKKWDHYFGLSIEKTEIKSKKVFKKTTCFLFLLRLLPFICLLGFIISLFWDFPGALYLPWRDQVEVPFYGLLRKISIAGLVGFFTNYLAIKMLFYPRKPRPILGHGLLPAQKEDIVLRLGEQISKELINADSVIAKINSSQIFEKYQKKLVHGMQEAIKDIAFRRDFYALIEYYINQLLRLPSFQNSLDEFINQVYPKDIGTVEGGLLKLYKFIKGERSFNRQIGTFLRQINFDIEQYETIIGKYLYKIPEKIESTSKDFKEQISQLIVYLIEKINIKSIIIENLSGLDESRLEKLLWHSTSNQLLYIQYFGCLLGLGGGFFLWLPLETTLLSILIGVALFSLDSLLIKIFPKQFNKSKL